MSARQAYTRLLAAFAIALIVTSSAWAAAGGSGAAGPQAPEGGADTLELSADEVHYSGKGRVTTASGKVVIVFGAFRITGDFAEYDDNAQLVHVKGKVRFEDTKENTVLLAGEVLFYLSEERADAAGSVSVDYQGGRSLASGDSLTYFSREKKGIIEGNARVEMGSKVFAAGSITVLFEQEAVTATGGTRVTIPGAELKPRGEKDGGQ